MVDDLEIIIVFIVRHIDRPEWYELYTTREIADKRCTALNSVYGTYYESTSLVVNQQIPSTDPSTNFCRRPNKQ